MAWRRPGVKPLSEPMMVINAYMCRSAPICLGKMRIIYWSLCMINKITISSLLYTTLRSASKNFYHTKRCFNGTVLSWGKAARLRRLMHQNTYTWRSLFALFVQNCYISSVCNCCFFGKTIPGWRHQMETFSALLTLCAGNSPVTGDFPAQRPVTRNFDVFFDLRLNKRLSKQSWG